MAARPETVDAQGVAASVPKEFWVRTPARFLKDSAISPEAKMLRAFIAAHADGETGETFVSRHTLQRLMRCGRQLREDAQAELVGTGWLKVKRERAERGRWGRNTYILLVPPPSATSAQFTGNGRTGSGATSSGRMSRISVPQSCHVTQRESLPNPVKALRNRKDDLT